MGYYVRTTSTARLRVSRDELRAALGGATRRGRAQELGLNSTGLIGHLLAGRRRSCTPELAEKIAEVAGVGFDELFVLVTPPVESRSASRRETGEAA